VTSAPGVHGADASRSDKAGVSHREVRFA
jgi:hypothetical protein